MRDLLARADLARYAGQFVCLELSYDEPQNRDFLSKYGAKATPTFLVINPRSEIVAAMQTGVMSLPELKGFLERGASVVRASEQSPADAAFTRGDSLLAQQPAEAAKAYQQALQLAPADWPQLGFAQASLVEALQASSQAQPCVESAIRFAATMKRDVLFVRTVVGGMWCMADSATSLWANAHLEKLQLFAEEALSLPITVRDHRDSIYRTLMLIEVARNKNAAALMWGDRWLAELDAIKPRSDDERTALDIARVENIQVSGDPRRILPALRASERAMPNNYVTSMRLAQMEIAAKQYDEGIATCRRGLTRTPGAQGKFWLLMIEADALDALGRKTEARQTLQDALKAAERIPSKQARENSIAKIKKILDSNSDQLR